MENEEESNLNDTDEETGSNTEEEFDTSAENREPGSSDVAMDLCQDFNSQQMDSYEVRIDPEAGSEPLTIDQVNEVPDNEARDGEISTQLPDADAQNDEDSNQQSQQHVPLLANSSNTLRRRASPINMVDNRPQREEPCSSRRWSISVVPPHFREVDEVAYTPKFVSIGPIHHKKMSKFVANGRGKKAIS